MTKTRKTLRKRAWKIKKLSFGVGLTILFLGSIFLGKNIAASTYEKIAPEPKLSVEMSAQRIDEECKGRIDNDQCFANAFYKLSQKNDSNFAVKTLLHLQEIDPQNTRGCHFTAHKISQAETEKDPNKWEEVIKKVSPTMCTGGFLHGVLESHVATDPDFTINENSITHICTDILNGTENRFAERSCAHNLGHLMIVQEEGKLQKAVEQCNKLKSDNFRYECLSGSFMETLTAENLMAHELIKVKPRWNIDLARSTEEVCSKYDGLAAQACWKEISYVYFAIRNSEPLGLYAECQRAPTKEMADGCYIYGAGNMVTGSNFKQENLITLCHQFAETDPMFPRCMDQTIGSMLTSTSSNLDKALTICSGTYENFRNGCYRRIKYFLGLTKVPQKVISNACSKFPQDIKSQICQG